MTSSITSKHLQSWIPPVFAWTMSPDVFCIQVSARDPDVVGFISTGTQSVNVLGTKSTTLVVALLIGKESLCGQINAAVWDSKKLKPIGSRIELGTGVTAHCHGVFSLPDGDNLCLVVGRYKPVDLSIWISAEVKAAADALHHDHQAKVTEFNERIESKKQANEAFKQRMQSDPNFGSWDGDTSIAMEEYHQRPVVTAEPLLPSFARAVTFHVQTSSNPDKVARSAVAAIAGSGWLPSRDGTYTGIQTNASGRNAQAIVTWEHHYGLPSYPEIRWAVQRGLPSSLVSPRHQASGRPTFDHGIQSSVDSAQVDLSSPGSWDFADSLNGMEIFSDDFQDRIKESRKDRAELGFEAIAWYQPYHVWTEDTWGIYFDAKKIDDLACSFIDDFKTHRVQGSHSLAALLAFGLTYAHELFHAKVEAALSWQEINALQPRHRRYKEHVYQALRETPEWLEEALANWSAWDWFKAPDIQAIVARMSTSGTGLDRIVTESLDLAPPGYQDWRLGHQPGTWRTFANQLVTGKPKIALPRIGVPIESVLTGPPPYEFLTADIPIRFAGKGIIAGRLQSQPATFNVPPRREIERALKHFLHNLDASGGKGGHQKWTGPDQRAFILPTRDPVSPGVFRTFLHHVGIDKATYVRQVRPNL